MTMPKAKSGDSRRAAVREKLRRTQAAPPVKRQALPVVCADPAAGLTSGQVRERERAGYCNTPVNPPSKSAKQIVLSNIFTYFNLVFFILAAALIAVGSWRNLTFLFIVFANTGIGIVQELRSKKTLDSLSILSAPKATVIRNGEPFTLDTARTVRDDIVIFQNGNQIFADAEVVEGSCQVNESLITGEADEIKKEPGDQLLSGSFLVQRQLQGTADGRRRGFLRLKADGGGEEGAAHPQIRDDALSDEARQMDRHHRHPLWRGAGGQGVFCGCTGMSPAALRRRSRRSSV